MAKLRHFITSFLPKFPYVLVYMLQQVEYYPKYFTQWLNRHPDFRYVIKRQTLILTKKATALLCVAYLIWLGTLAIGVYLVFSAEFVWGFVLLLLTPSFTVAALYLVCMFGALILQPSRQRLQNRARRKMHSHPAIKIAVLGSYGKTTLKELLSTVLSEAKDVAVTPGNMNVAISHARWIQKQLTGKEEIIIFEYGEFRPGDIARLAELTRPDIAVIGGVAPNHLENYDSYEALKFDLASIQLFVEPKKLYVDYATGEALGFVPEQYTGFDEKEILGWKVSGVKTRIEGTSFKLSKGKAVLELESGLVGKHLIAPIAFSAALAHRLGLTQGQIEAGVAKTRPFQHRMRPYELNGAWIIDDTYNGNIEGMRAGLALLRHLPAKRKIYVTPGLVEQGVEAQRVHVELGRLIAEAEPDQVILMNNSACSVIKASLETEGYQGEIRVVDDPLHFYQHLQYEVAGGDLVLLQNDWTDNYN